MYVKFAQQHMYVSTRQNSLMLGSYKIINFDRVIAYVMIGEV